MASSEGRYAALDGDINTSQDSKRLRGEGVSTSTKAGPASALKKTRVKEVQHDTGSLSSSARTKNSVEEEQSDKGEREIIIRREHFPAHPPEHALFGSQRYYEQYIRPYLGLKITATDELDASAKRLGYKNYVDGYCFQLVDV